MPGSADSVRAISGAGDGRQAEARGRVSGWRVEGDATGTSRIAIDVENPHSGQGSLRLTAAAPAASVVSDPFVPSAQANMTIQAFLRSNVPGARVRVWIEGESARRPYIRRSELSVSTTWDGRAVRASDLPPGGLDSARLRFELMTPGVLWIDDLRILGQPASKSARLNAQRTLLAALQAYREQRYADFARLAGSHWVQQSAAPGADRLARVTELIPRGGGPGAGPGAADAASAREAAASALPSERKLR
jgi:hypothetical protein